MTKQKKKKQGTPSSASKRKSQTLSLDKFLSPIGMNLMKEIDSIHQEEEEQAAHDGEISMNGSEYNPSKSGQLEIILPTDKSLNKQSIEIVVNQEEESFIEKANSHHTITNQPTVNQEPVMEISGFEQNTKKEETTLIQKPIEREAEKINNTSTPEEGYDNITQKTEIFEIVNPEQEKPEGNPSISISITSAMDSVSTTSVGKQSEQESTTTTSDKNGSKKEPQRTSVVETNAISKRVLEKLNITPEIRKTSTKDLSHVTKMTLIDPTNSNICCAFVTLDRPISHEDLRTRLEKRVVQKYSRFRSIVSSDYNNFCEQKSVDVEQHIRYLRVPKSGNREYSQTEEHEIVREFLGKLVCEPFDFSKPLWDCVVIDNCPALGYLLLIRIHHAIGDGASLVMFFSQFCDQGEEHFKEAVHERKVKLISQTFKSLEHVPIIGFFIRMISLMWLLWGLLLVMVKWCLMIMSGSDKSLFKTPISTEKQVSWSKSFDIADIKLVSKKICNNSTVNDIVLNSVSGSLIRFTERRYNKENQMKVTLSVPVNIRIEEEEFNDLSNKFGFMLVPLNLKNFSKNPESRLLQVKKIMDNNKKLPEPFFTYQSCRLVNVLPKNTVNTIYKFVSKWVSAIFTNPGVVSATQLTVEGIKVSSVVVFSPSPSSVGLSFALSSHNEKLVLGVCADTMTANPNELVKDFENDMDQIISMAKSLDLH